MLKKMSNTQMKDLLRYAKQFATRFGQIDMSDADDLSQDAMIRLIQNKHIVVKARGWLANAIRFEAMSAGRTVAARSARANSYDHNLENLLLVAEENGKYLELLSSNTSNLDFDVRNQLANVLSKLSESSRRILLLAAEGYTYEEIANITNAKIGTVRSRLSNARKYARKMLEDICE